SSMTALNRSATSPARPARRCRRALKSPSRTRISAPASSASRAAASVGSGAGSTAGAIVSAAVMASSQSVVGAPSAKVTGRFLIVIPTDVGRERPRLDCYHVRWRLRYVTTQVVRRIRLPADHSSPGAARAAVRAVAAEAGLAELLDEALLLTTE